MLYMSGFPFFSVRQNLHLPHVEWMYEIPFVILSTTKPQLLLIAHIVTSWREKTPKPWLLMGNSLLEDTFKPQGEQEVNFMPITSVVTHFLYLFAYKKSLFQSNLCAVLI